MKQQIRFDCALLVSNSLEYITTIDNVSRIVESGKISKTCCYCDNECTPYAIERCNATPTVNYYTVCKSCHSNNLSVKQWIDRVKSI